MWRRNRDGLLPAMLLTCALALFLASGAGSADGWRERLQREQPYLLRLLDMAAPEAKLAPANLARACDSITDWALDSRSETVRDALNWLVDEGRFDCLEAMSELAQTIRYDGEAQEWPEWTRLTNAAGLAGACNTDIARFHAALVGRRLALVLVFPAGVRVPPDAEYWVHLDCQGAGKFDASVRLAPDGTLSLRLPAQGASFVTLGRLLTRGNAVEMLLPAELTDCITQPAVRLRFVGPLRGDGSRQIIEGKVPVGAETGAAVALLHQAAAGGLAVDSPPSAEVLAAAKRIRGTLARVRRAGNVAIMLDDGAICAPVTPGPHVRPEAVGKPGFNVPLASRAFLSAGGYGPRCPDSYDFLVFFVNFPIYGIPTLAPPDGEKGGAHHPVWRSADGLGTPRCDLRSEHGSWGGLRAVLAMNTIHRDPQLQGERRVLWFMQRLAHECSHLWSVYVRFDPGAAFQEAPSRALLDSMGCHWSIFTHMTASLNSPKPGPPHELTDLGNGAFTLQRIAGDWRFSDWDLYLMGFLPPDQVAPTFVVLDPSASEAEVKVDQPFRGTRHEVSLSDVIAVEGPRVPDCERSPKHFRAAFILLTRGEMPTAEETGFVDALRSRFGDYWHEATRGLSTMDTRLDP